MNKKLFKYMYNMACEKKWLGEIAVGITNVSSLIFFVVYFFSCLSLYVSNDMRLYKVIIIPFVTICVNMLLRKILKKPRPFEEMGIETLIPHGKAYSFPSNHSASAMVIAIAMMWINPLSGIWLILAAIVTGASRIFTGLHYPKDVLAGFVVGIIFGVFGFWLG